MNNVGQEISQETNKILILLQRAKNGLFISQDAFDNAIEAVQKNLARIKELEDAIINHRDQKGDDRCFLDDRDLYAVLNDDSDYDTSLPPKEHFLKSCEKFWECRQQPDEKWERTPPPPKIDKTLRTVKSFLSWQKKDFESANPVTVSECIGFFQKEVGHIGAMLAEVNDTINSYLPVSKYGLCYKCHDPKCKFDDSIDVMLWSCEK